MRRSRSSSSRHAAPLPRRAAGPVPAARHAAAQSVFAMVRPARCHDTGPTVPRHRADRTVSQLERLADALPDVVEALHEFATDQLASDQATRLNLAIVVYDKARYPRRHASPMRHRPTLGTVSHATRYSARPDRDLRWRAERAGGTGPPQAPTRSVRCGRSTVVLRAVLCRFRGAFARNYSAVTAIIAQ